MRTILLTFAMASCGQAATTAQSPPTYSHLVSDPARFPVDQESIGRIAQAVRSIVPAPQSAPRRLFVFTKTTAHRHKSIPVGVAAMRMLGQHCRAFRVVHSEDERMFAPDLLNQFDAVCFLNTSGEPLTVDSHKQSLLTFVREGGGLVGIHAAANTCREWPEYGQIMGAYAQGHPWHEDVAIRLEDPAHPVTRMFGYRSFSITDEIYQFKAPYRRRSLHILMSLDPEKTRMDKPKVVRQDRDHPISWVNAYGRGRSFYCVLGHRHETYWNTDALAHFLAGIQFAMGDLEGSTEPSGAIAAGDPFEQLLSYDYGRSPYAVHTIWREAHRAAADPAAIEDRLEIEGGLLLVLQSPTASFVARQYACRMLGVVGSRSAVPILQQVSRGELRDAATYALHQIESTTESKDPP